jgi:transposase
MNRTSALAACVANEVGRGASGKTIVFGLLKRDGNVYTEIVPDCKKATL